ncbi:unnamed protein product [Lupinus luteus]|uniref:Knottins-like domain-containing protein n=1 Tax=Lupinus luteus TaxID=3873 RepID=A0AAV1WVF2_LUPLU
MAHHTPFVSTIFFFLLFLLATEMGPRMVVEARICESQSQLFTGPCMSETNCSVVCRSEGFVGGTCRKPLLQCFCTKPC